MIGFGDTLYTKFAKKPGGDDASEIAQQLISIDEQLSDSRSSVSKLIAAVQEESVRLQFANAERIIVESLRCLNAYNNMTDPAAKLYWRKEFLKWGSFIRESVSFLMDGMLGRGLVTISSDILQSIEQANLKSRTDQLFGVINTGLLVHAQFVQIMEISEVEK